MIYGVLALKAEYFTESARVISFGGSTGKCTDEFFSKNGIHDFHE